MNNKEKYAKVIGILKRNSPELSDKGNLTDQIMQGIKEPSLERSFHKKMTNKLFGWTDLYWVRVSMTAAALFFMGLFIVQQFIINNRLNRLEEQLVGQVDRAEVSSSDRGIILERQNDDSLMVSKDDLEALLKDYADMRKRFESARPTYFDQGSRIKYLLRKQRKKSDTINKSI